MSSSTWSIVYVSNNSLTSDESWRFLEDLEELIGDRLIICWDFNTKGGHWGSFSNNAQGNVLVNALIKMNLSVLNSIKKMTRLAT